MENAGCVTFVEAYIFRSRVTDFAREARAETILHEMAHMWFGDLVTMRWWDDLWLNESFATFMSVLAQVEATRFKNGWVTFANQYKAGARRQDQLPTTHPVAADIPDIESVYLNFHARTSDGLHLRWRVELDVAAANTPVKDFDGERLADLLLVNDLDLTYAKIRLDERSLATASEHLAELADPLARAITWAALWDMLRDAEIPARRYLPLILQNIHRETA